jgi:hypothetical protein
MKRPAMSLTVVLVLLILPAGGWAQDASSGSIAGVVRDEGGAVLPGVTVEASSPALIERTRTGVTDGEGRYRLIDLRPGTYTVTFTLAGFKTVRREGIELTTGFIANVNADLGVGAVEETITVTGAAPVVDVQGIVQQQVFSREVVRTLPMGKNAGIYAALIPGAAPLQLTQQDVGGTKGEDTQWFRMHNSGRSTQLRDGMFVGLPMGGANFNSAVNPATIDEVTVQLTGALTAEAQGDGPQTNFVPRDGGNVFNGSFNADFGHTNLQGDNISGDLRARGAARPGDLRKLYDVGGGFGGPIARDRVWFFASSRYNEASSYAPNNYYNKTTGTLFYEPDLSRPAYDLNYYQELGVRLTVQAAAKHKVTFLARNERSCACLRDVLAGTKSPEASGDRRYPWGTYTFQGGWTNPLTNRVLLEAGANLLGDRIISRFANDGTPDDSPDDIAVFDRVRNYWYGSPGETLNQGVARGFQDFSSLNIRGSLSYVTGSHSFKAGIQVRRATLDNNFFINHDVSYTFAGRVPESVTFWATPYENKTRVLQGAYFAQDQWTINRLTLNLGLRIDHVNGYVPEQHLAAGPWVPARDFAEVKDAPDWKDIDPRLGVAYDLFGTGRTAVKASIGRFVPIQSNIPIGTTSGIVFPNNPVSAMVISSTRTWTDANGDYVPQEAELGPPSAVDFGRPRIVTRYADDILRGWNNGPYSWQGSVAVQHELRTGLAVNVGYFRTWYGNFFATDNLLVGPEDYDTFCITAPNDSRLPNPGALVCDLLAIKPNKFGQQNNVVTNAKHFGHQQDLHNAVDITLNARFGNGGLVTGGVSMGKTVTDNCEVLAKLPEMTTAAVGPLGADALRASPKSVCRVEPPLTAGTQFKLSGAYNLPWDLKVSANYQNNPGVDTTATYVATNAEILPSLGRNLAAGVRGTANVELITPQSQFREGRLNQLNFAVNRMFRVRTSRIQPRFELHNALNSASILALNQRYGATWQQVRTLLAPRMAKFALQIDF